MYTLAIERSALDEQSFFPEIGLPLTTLALSRAKPHTDKRMKLLPHSWFFVPAIIEFPTESAEPVFNNFSLRALRSPRLFSDS